MNINNTVPDAGFKARAKSADPQTDVINLWMAVKRGRRTIAKTTIATLCLAVAYLAIETPLYQAESAIIIDTATSRTMQSKGQTAAGASDNGVESIDNNLVDSQVEVLSSDGFAALVVTKMGLDHDPEFVGPPNRLVPRILASVSGVVGAVKSLVGAKDAREESPVDRAVGVFSKRLIVKRNALTYLINITFSSDDAGKAAKIADGVANIYLKSLLDSKYAAARGTGQWIQDQLAEVRKRATDDDRAVQMFKAENHIVDTNRGLMSEQNLGELNSQLAVAASTVAEAQSKLARARAVMNDPTQVSTLSDALSNPVISRLRAQYLDLSSRAGDLSLRLGAQHGTVLALKAQMAQIQNSIKAEFAQLVNAYESDYQIALARQNSLQASLNALVTDNAPGNLAQVKLKDLESAAETSRTLLTAYLQKYQDASQLETFPISDGRVVTSAMVPIKPNNPKSAVVLGGGVVLGLLIGAMTVVAKELMSQGFMTGRDLEHATGLRFLGVLPKVSQNRRRPKAASQDPKVVSFANGDDTYVIDAPFSRFAESIRSVKVAIDDLRLSEPRAKIVGVVSAAPAEGKTTIALNLAQSLAASGARTLLVDCDVRTCDLSMRVGVSANAAPALVELMAGQASLADCLRKDPISGLDVLPCVPPPQAAGRMLTLSAEALGPLLNEIKHSYAYIILDIAPIVPVVDARAIAHLVDGFLLVVKWGETNRKMVLEAVHTDNVEHRILGAVLNQADDKVLQELEAYKGVNANKYYK
jgi:succinoglycan biosynthesis transport protein ExoP